MQQREFSMPVRPPFRLDLTVWAVRRRSDNAIDRWDGATYRRGVALESGAIELAAAQAGSPSQPQINVTLTGARLDAHAEAAARTALNRLLGLAVDLSDFYRLASSDPHLNELVARFRGLKPPRFPTLFECIVNAIACQQLTLTVGIRLLNRLAETHGSSFGDDAPHAFPLPAQLSGLPHDALKPLGFSGAKSRSAIELAAIITAGKFDPVGLETLDDDEALAALQSLRGIGRWTSEYALLRGLGRVHVFPGDDVGARNNLARWLDLPGPLTYGDVEAAVHRWQPYAGLLYFHLLLDNLADQGLLAECAPPVA